MIPELFLEFQGHFNFQIRRHWDPNFLRFTRSSGLSSCFVFVKHERVVTVLKHWNPVFQGYRCRIGGVRATYRFFRRTRQVFRATYLQVFRRTDGHPVIRRDVLFPYIHKYLHPTLQIRIGHPMDQGLRHHLYDLDWILVDCSRAHASRRCVQNAYVCVRFWSAVVFKIILS